MSINNFYRGGTNISYVSNLIFVFMLFYSCSLNADEFQVDASNIYVMYNIENSSIAKKYNIDGVTWGGQIGDNDISRIRAKYTIEKNKKYGVYLNSVDIALVQEGGKYVICGNIWNAKCDNQYWSLRKNNQLLPVLIRNDISILKRAAVDGKKEIVGVPWLSAWGKIVPMANVNDPGYKNWIIKKLIRHYL